jgi:hypothetical protein
VSNYENVVVSRRGKPAPWGGTIEKIIEGIEFIKCKDTVEVPGMAAKQRDPVVQRRDVARSIGFRLARPRHQAKAQGRATFRGVQWYYIGLYGPLPLDRGASQRYSVDNTERQEAGS